MVSRCIALIYYLKLLRSEGKGRNISTIHLLIMLYIFQFEKTTLAAHNTLNKCLPSNTHYWVILYRKPTKFCI